MAGGLSWRASPGSLAAATFSRRGFQGAGPTARRQLTSRRILGDRRPGTSIRPAVPPASQRPTVTTISFEPLLTPHAFFARMRTKYVPAPTPGAKNDVAVLSVSKFARFAAPGYDPASM